MSQPLEFVVFYEKNYKEDELYIFYLQWTGNEEALRILERAVSKACYEDLYGDYSMVHLDISVKLPESVVDAQCRLTNTMNSYYQLFTKCVGKFNCPFTETYLENLDKYIIADLMDQIFYSCRIRHMFTK